MTIKKQINDIVSAQEKYIELKKNILRNCKKLEKEVGKVVLEKLKEAFPEVRFRPDDLNISTECGCLTNKWEVEVEIIAINGYQLAGCGYWYEVFLGEMNKTKLPIRLGKFRNFLKTLSEELGIKCKLVKQEPYYAENSLGD